MRSWLVRAWWVLFALATLLGFSTAFRDAKAPCGCACEVCLCNPVE